VTELDRRDGAVPQGKLRDPCMARDLAVSPEAWTAVGDASPLLHRRRFCEHDTRTSYGEATQVDQVPVVEVTFVRRVLAHGRDHDAVARFDAADHQRLEEVWRVGHRKPPGVFRAVLARRYSDFKKCRCQKFRVNWICSIDLG
jgi:hypothetical protein